MTSPIVAPESKEEENALLKRELRLSSQKIADLESRLSVSCCPEFHEEQEEELLLVVGCGGGFGGMGEMLTVGGVSFVRIPRKRIKPWT